MKDIDLKVQKGQCLALVGPSGTGKTTISYLIPRLYYSTDGKVLFAGSDAGNIKQAELTDHIGIVSQSIYVFHATTRENLSMES